MQALQTLSDRKLHVVTFRHSPGTKPRAVKIWLAEDEDPRDALALYPHAEVLSVERVGEGR